MIRRLNGSGSTVRPHDSDAWICAGETARRLAAPPACTARLTVDVTPDLRDRIKIAAVRRGLTMGAMLRDLLGEAFPETPEDAP